MKRIQFMLTRKKALLLFRAERRLKTVDKWLYERGEIVPLAFCLVIVFLLQVVLFLS